MTVPPGQETGEVPDPDFPPPPPPTVGRVLYDTMPVLMGLVTDQRFGHLMFSYFDAELGLVASVNVSYGQDPTVQIPPDADDMPPDA